MIIRTCFTLILLWAGSSISYAGGLDKHFWGPSSKCLYRRPEPVVIIADLTVTGEIDDNLTVRQFERLARQLDCVKILGIVSIFGNGESTTEEIHRNLKARLPLLGLEAVPLLRGPDESLLKIAGKAESKSKETPADQTRLRRIAAMIQSVPGPVTSVELGPLTVSARLLRDGYLRPQKVRRILGVGGRAWGERFSTGKKLGRLGAFTDFNIRKDTAAADYLVRYHPEKLWMVTYQTGIGVRLVKATTATTAIPKLREHIVARTRFMCRLGYRCGYFPSWDTWLSTLFIEGGAERLGCLKTRAHIRAEHRDGHNMRLILNPPEGHPGHAIMACHKVAK